MAKTPASPMNPQPISRPPQPPAPLTPADVLEDVMPGKWPGLIKKDYD
jgi:hypothetical protein